MEDLNKDLNKDFGGGLDGSSGQVLGENLNKSSTQKKFDWKWVVSGVVVLGLIGGLTAALIVKNNSGDSSNYSQTIDIDNGDNKIDWDEYGNYSVELSETYTITSSGTYYLTGTISDGAVIIKADSEAAVKLVLNGVTIKNSSGPAIACLSASDLVIEASGENYLEDGKTYSSEWDEDVSGALYTKSDLTLTGEGTLTIKANHADGIVSKDDLTIRSGTYKITAVDDGIRGKDSVHIVDGAIEVTASGDGIKSSNDTDATKGFVLVEGGTITVAASDDGIKAETKLIIDGGTIDITKSYEGLEGQTVTINGGEISVVASDDGINAAGGSDSSSNNPMAADTNCTITINGGTVYVNAGGDGVDSNGYVYFNGGTVAIDGPTNNGNGALDSGAGIVMNGGTVIAVGASGMAETLGSSSSINNISVYFTSTLAKGTLIEIKNAAGETVLSHTSAKTFNHLSAGTDKFKMGETYTIYINGSEYTSFAISGTTTTVGSGGQSGMPNGGQNSASGQNGQQNYAPGQRR